MRILPLLLALALSAFPAAAASPPALALEALASIDRFSQENWSYTKTSRANGVERVERHDATRAPNERWTLISVDGRAPTSKELKKYAREKEDQRKRGSDDGDDDGGVDESTIELIAETPLRSTFRFHPRAGMLLRGEESRKVAGTIVVNREGRWAERFELRNTAPIRPLPGVNVSEFMISMTFRRDADSGEILPVRFANRIRGKLLLKSIDSDQIASYSHFVRVR